MLMLSSNVEGLMDTSAIHSLVAKARRRIRAQWAIEGATIASIPASALALVAIFSIRAEW